MDGLTHEIKAQLSLLECELDITILYACESGSRAWGFPSRDSDYDIRIIYVRNIVEAFKLRPKPDSFEHKILHEVGGRVEVLDVAGWELSKALTLMTKSNAGLLEWLQSPIEYVALGGFKNDILELSTTYIDPKALVYHYANMAARCLTDHLKTPTVKLKKYFYCIRPILAGMYVIKTGQVPPLDFMTLFNSEYLKLSEILTYKIEQLYLRKCASSSEADRETVDIELLDWIEGSIVGLRSSCHAMTSKKNTLSPDILDTFLYETVVRYDRISRVGQST